MRRALITLALAVVALAILAAPAQAAFGLNNFESKTEDELGGEVTQAGSHPFQLNTSFGFNYTGTGAEALPEGQPRNIELQLPPGFAGAPSAVPKCPHALFLQLNEATNPACPDDTAVGVAEVEALLPGPPARRAVFNLVPPPGAVAEFGFIVVREPVTIDFYLNPTPPYNVIAKITNAVSAAKLFGSEVKIWGNPASPVHDAQRGNCVFGTLGKCPVSIPEKAFITLPRACTGPLPTTYEALSWQGQTDSGEDPTPLETDGCQELGFEPEIEAQPSTEAGESPTGLDFEVSVDDPNLTDPSESAIADSDIKAIEAALPAGMTVNPSAANGQSACSSAELAEETLTHQGCPEASRIGTLEVETPLLEGEVLPGSVYLAAQGDNPFGSLLALYVVIKDPQLGVLVKQAGEVKADPQTGQLLTRFGERAGEEIPQLPFSSLRVHLRAGARAPLVTPAACGEYETKATLTPWDESLEPIEASSSFTVSEHCSVLPFGPGFGAGTASNAATAYSPFSLRITRKDGEPELSSFSTMLPPGVLGKLAGLTECAEAAIEAARKKSGREELASPSCPASALMGHVLAGAGVGEELTYVQGSLYLAGPYMGDPLSVVAITPALAGPFDLGDVVVREPLALDETTAQIRVDGAKGEPFPHILEGIPLRLRDLRVSVDHASTFNASGCEPFATSAQIFATNAASFSASSPYQASGCKSLGFGPKLSLQLKGKTKRTIHPATESTAIKSVVTYPYPSGPGYSNIAKATVVLPPSLQVDQAHVGNPCTRPQFAAHECPAHSILGFAKATTPLLDKPLEGPVYFRSNPAHTLPDIVADLHGQVDFTLVGEVDSIVNKKAGNSRIRTTFASTPDAPVTRFELSLYGGKRGLLVNNRNLCKSPQKAQLSLLAHNNALRESTVKVKTPCKG